MRKTRQFFSVTENDPGKILIKIFIVLWIVLLFILPVSNAQISIPGAAPVTENFDGIGTSATASLPANWKMTSAGTGLTSGWLTGTNVTTTTQAANSGSPATGGRYNWATTPNTDRAVGFMTSGSYGSPNGILAFYRNNTGAMITDLNVVFQIERYRINTTNFSLSFFSSLDGSTWTAQPGGDIAAGVFATGSSSYTFGSPQTVVVNTSLSAINIPIAGDVYLKWVFNTGGSSSQGLGLDEVSVTVCNAPTVQASNITFSTVLTNSMTVNWTNGNGGNRVVIINTINSFTNPANGTSPAANSVYGGAGEQVVYNGSGNSVNITGLTPNTNYWIRVYEYNCTGASTKFNTSTAANNPNSQTTPLVSSNPGDYFRSRVTGVWSMANTWETSPDNGITPWIISTLIPTSAAAAVTIMAGHTVTIDMAATAPNLTINGTLTFDGVAARSISVTNYVTVNAGGIYITQAAGTFSNTMTMGGDLTNNGTFDMSRGTTTLVCDVTFNRNGNQNITGTGATTRFHYMTVNLGSSYSNILDITTNNFAARANFLHVASGSSNLLQNGTIRFSGTFTYTGTLFLPGSFYTIGSTAGVWLNNPNVTISGQNDSYVLAGYLRITNGSFNMGTVNGNSLRYKTGSVLIMEGGTLTVAGRLQADAGADLLNYSQSNGTFILFATGAVSSSVGTFDVRNAGSSFTMSNGTIIFRNQNLFYTDVYIPNGMATNITGGTMQFTDFATGSFNTTGFWINSLTPLPSVYIYSINVAGIWPVVRLAKNLAIQGDLTIGTWTTFDASFDGTSANSFNATISGNASVPGNWTNNGYFIQRDKLVTFNGILNQTIGGTRVTTYRSMTINKSSGMVILGINANVGLNSITSANDGVFTLTNGPLSLNTFKLTIINPFAAGISGGNPSSYIISETSVGTPLLAVNPSIVQWNVSTNTGNRTIPFGVSGTLIPFIFNKTNSVDASVLVSTRATANDNLPWTDVTNVGAVTDMYSNTIGGDGSIPVVIDRWWELTATAPGVTANLTFTYRGIENTLNAGYSTGSLAAQNWDGTIWLPPVCSSCNAGVLAGTGTVVVNGASITNSPWVLSAQLAPLPISLLSFTAEKAGDDVNLKWITSSEINNDYFQVLVSQTPANNQSFEAIGWVDGSGNTSENKYYTFKDSRSGKAGTYYYKLKQVDYDGRYSYSPVAIVNFNKNKLFEVAGVFPNPFASELNVQVYSQQDLEMQVFVSDLAGRTIIKHQIIINAGATNVSLPLLNLLADGLYMLRLEANGESYFTKIVRQ